MTEPAEPWIEAALGDLGQWRGGFTPSKANAHFWKNGTIPWVSPKDFGSPTVDDAADRITEAAIAGAAIIPAGSMLVVTRSGVLRHSLPVACNTAPVAINQDVKALILGPGLDPDFFRYQISALSQEILNATVKSGTTVESVDFSSLKEFRVLVAPTSEQQRVTQNLDFATGNLRRVRRSLKVAVENVGRLKAAVLESAFRGELTKGWRIENGADAPWLDKSVADVAESISYGSSRKSQAQGDTAVLRMGNIQDGMLDLTDLVYTSDPGEIRKYILRDGDVLFNRTNSPELVGKTAIFRSSIHAIAAGYLVVVRCQDMIIPEILGYFLNSPSGRAYFWRVKSDGVSQSNVNAKKLAAFRFCLPSLPEQQEIVRRVGSVLDRLRNIEATLSRAMADVDGLERAIIRDAYRREPSDEDADNSVYSLVAEAKLFSESAIPAIRSRGQGMITRSSPIDMVLAEVKEWPTDGVTFDELWDSVPVDYDTLKDTIFELMSGITPVIYQKFDLRTKSMRFKGSGK